MVWRERTGAEEPDEVERRPFTAGNSSNEVGRSARFVPSCAQGSGEGPVEESPRRVVASEDVAVRSKPRVFRRPLDQGVQIDAVGAGSIDGVDQVGQKRADLDDVLLAERCAMSRNEGMDRPVVDLVQNPDP